MNAETIKDFLVSLGFSVDDAGAKKIRFCPRRYNCKCHQNGAGRRRSGAVRGGLHG